ncbi:hypothetical protein PLESTB_000648700 [Pleodorina starrii]|uniref:Uncharacterized protein n=1 Tax=Pleodorina starrii TaxID=330485 RepID=A0A9W6BIG9_9CHLO|nr:hypothetical protein PLESTB_000648700 [Pleodorina starrii]
MRGVNFELKDMQATAQQALRWRWLSPRGIQVVTDASTPAFSRAGGLASAAHPLASVGSIHSSTATDATGLSSHADRTCVASRASGNGSVNGTCNCRACGAACAVARRRPSLSKRTALNSFASAAATSTVLIEAPLPRTALEGGDAAPAPAASPAAARPLPHSGQLQSPQRPPSQPPGPTKPASSLPPVAALQHQRAPTLARAHLRRPPPSVEAVHRITLAATPAFATAAAPTADHFHHPDRASPEPPLPTRHIVAAVDPDLGGALAFIYWDEEPPAAAAAGDGDDGGRGAAATAAATPSSSSIWPVAEAGGWPLVVPSPADLGLAARGPRAGNRGRRSGAAAAAAPAAKDDAAEEEEEDGDGGGGGGGSVAAGELWLPAPPPPPADVSRWNVRVWDMPVSAAERQKRTITGGISKRRLLHVAGARAVLASALAAALPPPEEQHRRQVALYGYVEVPPILPGDGNISAYTCLWSTGAWLGLLTGMGFTVGSTPVRRWKQDLGLFGARSKDAGLALARLLFPAQARILKFKKDHGRADALLIGAWALGARLPAGLASTLRRNQMTLDELLAEQPAAAGLTWGPPRPPAPTDAYGNLLTPERDMMDEIEAAQVKVDRQEEVRQARKTKGRKATPIAAAATTATAAAVVSDDHNDSSRSSDADAGASAVATTPAVRRRRRAKDAAAAEQTPPAGPGAVMATTTGDSDSGVGANDGVESTGSMPQRRKRRTKKEMELATAAEAAAASVAARTRGGEATTIAATAAAADTTAAAVGDDCNDSSHSSDADAGASASDSTPAVRRRRRAKDAAAAEQTPPDGSGAVISMATGGSDSGVGGDDGGESMGSVPQRRKRRTKKEMEQAAAAEAAAATEADAAVAADDVVGAASSPSSTVARRRRGRPSRADSIKAKAAATAAMAEEVAAAADKD